MELFRPQAPSCQSPSMCQCVGIVSTKERVMAVVANLRRSWIQCHLPRQRIWQCPLSDSKHGHLWLQNYWSHTIGSANLGAKAIESCIDLIFTLDRSKHRIHPRLLCQFLCIVHQDPTHDCKTQCTVVSAPVSAPVCPGSAPRLPRSAPRLPRVCPVSAPVCPASAPCLHRSAPCLPRYAPLGYRFLWCVEDGWPSPWRITVIVTSGCPRLFIFSLRCTDSLAKVLRPWTGAILRTGMPYRSTDYRVLWFSRRSQFSQTSKTDDRLKLDHQLQSIDGLNLIFSWMHLVLFIK